MNQDQIKGLRLRVKTLGDYLDVAQKIALIEEKEAITVQPDFWDHPKAAQKVLQEVAALKVWTDAYTSAQEKVGEVEVLAEFAAEGEVEETEVEAAFKTALVAIEELEFKKMLNRDEDRLNCVLEINSGAGGVEAQDWVEMLKRMYTMYADKNGFKWALIDEVVGETAGLKSTEIEILGDFAYGYLKGEKGVHRMVRISPFNAQGKRQTTFASVDVRPMVDDTIEIEIKADEIDVQTTHASGKGGQNVNKVETAVRIKHIETGITVFTQTERSQLRNKEKAMQLLKSKLYQLELEKKNAERDDAESEKMNIEWGSQIRNYVFNPYKQVKDVRTELKSTNLQDVMDGELGEFIKTFLMMGSK
ncbi:MAG: peptide chain release factor 2 [Bacteroidia bacterium]